VEILGQRCDHLSDPDCAAVLSAKCALFAIPISLLFSTSFTLGTFYSNNELIIVFGSGIPLFRFIARSSSPESS
jgi:hypothetical protein